jgi:hypothetical protein
MIQVNESMRELLNKKPTETRQGLTRPRKRLKKRSQTFARIFSKS